MNIEGLSREQRDLMECIGLEAYGKLVKSYGGSRIYIGQARYRRKVKTQ